MSAVDPVRIDPAELKERPDLWIELTQPGGLALRLKDLGVTKRGFQSLHDHPKATVQLIDLLAVRPAEVKAMLAQMVAELRPLLPLFAERLKPNIGWHVDDDRGHRLPADWDPGVFLTGRAIGCVHPDDVRYMKGEDLIAEARKRLGGREGFSQHELAWFVHNWQDERIPDWFREAIKRGAVRLVATETVLLHPDGKRYVLYLGSCGDQPFWDCLALDDKQWDWCKQVLTTD